MMFFIGKKRAAWLEVARQKRVNEVIDFFWKSDSKSKIPMNGEITKECEEDLLQLLEDESGWTRLYEDILIPQGYYKELGEHDKDVLKRWIEDHQCYWYKW